MRNSFLEYETADQKGNPVVRLIKAYTITDVSFRVHHEIGSLSIKTQGDKQWISIAQCESELSEKLYEEFRSFLASQNHRPIFNVKEVIIEIQASEPQQQVLFDAA